MKTKYSWQKLEAFSKNMEPRIAQSVQQMDILWTVLGLTSVLFSGYRGESGRDTKLTTGLDSVGNQQK
jgi:hypothetical protein